MIEVNAIGNACPIPVIKTKKALSELGGAGTVKVYVDNETAVQNVTKMAQSAGGNVTCEKEEEKKYVLTIEMEKAPVFDDETTGEGPKAGPTVVAVSSDKMGEGNDELGHVLIKSFIFAISQLEKLPKTMIFYNGGAQLTCEGSPCLEDLKNLESEGVEILTCGTCLDYYNLKEKLAVGSVSNMYTIVEKLNGAGNIIKP